MKRYSIVRIDLIDIFSYSKFGVNGTNYLVRCAIALSTTSLSVGGW